ncbi:MAG: hypothetical protein JSS89_03845 [Bacteroidetes bacterium]|nr:hypothetical protein [Bacteroidota bacterium]
MKIRVFLAAMLLSTMAFTAQAITPDEIITKSIDAQGGLAKFKALTSYSATGTMAMAQMQMDMSFALKVKRGGKMRFENEVQGMKFVTAIDGSTGWMINPMTGTGKAEKLPDENVKDMKDMADIDGDLVGYKEDGWTVENLGSVDVEGSTAYKLKFTKEKDTKFVYIDAVSFLELKQEKKSSMMGQEMDVETIYSDYQNVGGIMRPFQMELRTQGTTIQTITLKKIETNIEIADSVFTMPK